MSRKGSKNLTESERNLLISVIDDYKVCDLPDQKMIEILSQRLGRSIKKSLYYSLKSAAKKNRQSSEEWLDNFCKYGGLVEFHKQRLDESLFVQKELLKLYADEANKKDTITKQNRVLMSKIAKIISDNSKTMSEIGIGSSIILAKLQSLIPKELLQGDLKYTEKYFDSMSEKEKILWNYDGGRRGPSSSMVDNNNNVVDPFHRKTALPPPIHDQEENDNGSSGGTQSTSGDPEDEQAVF